MFTKCLWPMCQHRSRLCLLMMICLDKNLLEILASVCLKLLLKHQKMPLEILKYLTFQFTNNMYWWFWWISGELLYFLNFFQPDKLYMQFLYSNTSTVLGCNFSFLEFYNTNYMMRLEKISWFSYLINHKPSFII